MNARYRKLFKEYTARFGVKPEFTARAPGRVNLIGEHTDYNGCPVLPMALERDFEAVFSPVPDGRAVLANTCSGFPDREFELSPEIPPFAQGDWGNYCKAGVQAVINYAAAHPEARPDAAAELTGFQAVLNGTVPPAAGLSSSSALVVLSALMFVTVNGLRIQPEVLAQVLAEGERYVGTQGGGMDQAASLLSSEGKAVKIDFNPFAVMPVEMPAGYTVVVADSTVKAAKTGAAMDRYNLRTVECRLGTALLDRAFGLRSGRAPEFRLLGDLTPEKLGMSTEEILDFVRRELAAPAYRLEDIAEALDTTPAAAAAEFCRRRDGTILPEPDGGYKVRQRVLHVLTEWRRVEDSVAALTRGDPETFGALMNSSHESCRDLYEISCPELEVLVGAARDAGASGSRLTGAGFGGCTVSLVRDDRVERFSRDVFDRYYREYLGGGQAAGEDLLFSCKPGGGAAARKI